MKKFLQKKPMLLLCALLLFSLGCMGVLAVAEPKGAGSTAETEVMTDGAVPLADGAEDGIDTVKTATPSESQAPEVETNTVLLDPGAGELGEIDEVLVDAATGRILSELPDPTREGWKFEGWYTDKATEKLLTGGYPTEPGSAVPRGDDEDLKDTLRQEMKDAGKNPTEVDNMSDQAVLAELNHWLVLPHGEKVVKDGKVKEDVGTLYAMYTPLSYTVKYHHNGWKGQTGAFEVSAQYGAPISSYNLNVRSEWAGHTLEGWSLEPDGAVVLEEMSSQGDTVYRMGEAPLVIPKSGRVIDLYAVGAFPKVKEISVYMQKSTLRHGKDGWHVQLNYTISPKSEQNTNVTWSVDRSDIASVTVNSNKLYEAELAVGGPSAINERTVVTVTVTSDNGVSGSCQVEIAHNWIETYSYKPNCKHTGSVTYRCSSCERSWTESLGKTEHKFVRTHTAATCTTEGYTEQVCSDCGLKEITDRQPATGHTWGTVQIVSGCGGAVKTKTCTVCGFTETDVDANDAAHQWEPEMTVDKAPTCSEAGSRSYHCVVCGLTKGSETIPANPDLHRWAEWQVTKKAQIGVMGEESRRCLTCRDVETRDIEALLPTVDSVAADNSSNSGAATPSGDPAPESVPSRPSSSSGGSSGGYSGGGSSGGSGGGGGGGSSRGGSGGGAAMAAAAGPMAGAASTPLPVVPTAEIREALPNYVEVGTWSKAADGSWTCKDESGKPYTNRWAAVYNPYANTAAADAYDWFRFDETGHLIVGWYVDPADGCTYYMNPSSDGTQGKMMTGWVVIDGKEYYFNPSSNGQRGRMYKNETTPDGHFVGPDGAKIR